MMPLQWLPEALHDLQRLHAFIAAHNFEAANRAIETLVNAADTLSDFPEKGHPWQPDTHFRELPVRFGAKGYVIRYRIYDNQVIIIRIWHGTETR